MKKILSLLGTITLIGTSTTTLISCEKPNNNENGGVNKPEPKPEPEKPEEPPRNSNWKLVDGFINEKNNDNKKYIGIVKIENGWKIIKWTEKNIEWKYQYKSIYRWDGNGEPQMPEIDTNTGKIIN
ncbi:lipoprotein [Spiroplasma poulsonii]|uniref:lipoprotein n=1 Tax=Spiroplasma poulsonii TaxID=2138 RepID=UPI001F4C9C0C|nr:lipoprotein [Spiroplasma poulsonii]UNF61183.1 lipoprotein [Spiroplasma poulsonii]